MTATFSIAFFPRDVPQNTLIGRMQGILVLLPLDLATNLFDHSRPGTYELKKEIQMVAEVWRRAEAAVYWTWSKMQDAMDELVQKYSRQGHPSAEELVAAQGLTFPRDPRDLLGNFWPEDESIDDFLAEMRAWRGRARTDPAA